MSIESRIHPEFHKNINISSRLNWLRALVLGANDGIVSTAGLVVGVAGATQSINIILTAGIAGIIAGAVSMAAGEYISVSSAKDTERSLLEKERYELTHFPEEELKELIQIYVSKGLTKDTARLVAKELSHHGAYAAHVDAELGINPNNLTNPWDAAIASAGAFLIGSSIPLVGILIPPASIRIPFTFLAVVLALAITGGVSAKLGNAPLLKAVLRVVMGGIIAMCATYIIGYVFGVNVLG